MSIKYYALMKGFDVPEQVIRTTRCFNNQFEVPVFFYVAGTLYISLGMNDSLGVILAWLVVFALWGSIVVHNL